MTRTLVPRNIQVDHFEALTESKKDLADYGFVLIDFDATDQAQLENILNNAAADYGRVILFSQNRELAKLGELLSHRNLCNFIAKNGGIREEELLITMHKLLTGEFFGMTQYLAHGTIPIEQQLRSSKERVPALEEMVSFLQECLVSKRFVELARSAADELLMNALLRAPATSSVDLETVAEPQLQGPAVLQYACDGRHVGMSVSDRYGSLTEERLLGFLGRCFTMDEYKVPQDTVGGGLGLYVAFRSSDQFVVNIEQGIKTEILCLIDIRGNLRDFEERSKSFHLFFRENQPCPTT